MSEQPAPRAAAQEGCGVKKWIPVFALFLAGCGSGHKAPDLAPVPRPDVGRVVDGQGKKDSTVVASANNIDNIASEKAPNVAPEIKVETDAIRKAVAENPAVVVEELVKQFNRALDLHEKRGAELQAVIAALQKQIADMEDRELKKQIATFRWAGFGLISLAVGLFFAKQPEYAAAAGLIGVLSLGLAQLFAQPWFSIALQIAAGLAAVGLGWAIFHAYRKRTLAAKVANEADRFRATLPKVVRVLDEAYEEGGSAVAEILDKYVFAKLSSGPLSLDRDGKNLIHENRVQ